MKCLPSLPVLFSGGTVNIVWAVRHKTRKTVINLKKIYIYTNESTSSIRFRKLQRRNVQIFVLEFVRSIEIILWSFLWTNIFLHFFKEINGNQLKCLSNWNKFVNNKTHRFIDNIQYGCKVWRITDYRSFEELITRFSCMSVLMWIFLFFPYSVSWLAMACNLNVDI